MLAKLVEWQLTPPSRKMRENRIINKDDMQDELLHEVLFQEILIELRRRLQEEARKT